ERLMEPRAAWVKFPPRVRVEVSALIVPALLQLPANVSDEPVALIWPVEVVDQLGLVMVSVPPFLASRMEFLVKSLEGMRIVLERVWEEMVPLLISPVGEMVPPWAPVLTAMPGTSVSVEGPLDMIWLKLLFPPSKEMFPAPVMD